MVVMVVMVVMEVMAAMGLLSSPASSQPASQPTPPLMLNLENTLECAPLAE